MKKFLIVLLFLTTTVCRAQFTFPDIEEESQNKALLNQMEDSVSYTESMDFSQESFITETYQIPAYNLYSREWDTEHLRSRQYAIPFTDHILKIILVESHNSPFIYPCRGNVITTYGIQRRNKFHPGIDFQLNPDDPVYACFDGVVRMAKEYGDYGKMVTVRHYNGLETVYAHLNRIYVKPGQIIHAGHILGLAGNSGNTENTILHFETRFLNEHFNPDLMLDFEDRTLKSNMLTLQPANFTITPIPVIPQKNEKNKAPAGENGEEGRNRDTMENTHDSENAPFLDNNNREDFPDYHTVQKGETLYRVSIKYNIPVEELIRINQLSDKGTIQPGQKLKLK